MKAKLKTSLIWQIVRYLLLPIGLLVDGLKVSRSAGKKILVVLAVLVIGGYWALSVLRIVGAAGVVAFETGIWKTFTDVPVSGTSMMPTILDKSKVKLASTGGHTFQRGDIVSFTNAATMGLHFLKRIVGLPGEKIVVKNGQVFINGKPLGESYIYQHAGTFGNTFLLECQSQTIPKDSYVVMGDNRTVSWDSRAIGFVSATDISAYMTPKERPVVGATVGGKVPDNYTLDSAKLMALINAKREENHVGDLLPSDLLSTIAKNRAGEVSKNLGTWKTNQLLVEKTLDKAGYRYNLAYEFVTFGYLDEAGVVNQIMENPDAKNALLSGNFWEGGVGYTEVTNGDCKYPVISLILTWPSLPTYSQKTIDYWNKEVADTATLLANLQSWVGTPGKDPDQLKQAISYTAQAHEIATRISAKIAAKQWFDAQDYVDTRTYQDLVTKNNALENQLFPNVKGASTDSIQPKLF